MVRKVHKYANGGQVKDHSTETSYRYPKPTYMDAVKDRVKGMFTGGAAGKAAKEVDSNRRKRDLDRAIDDMSG